MEGVDYILVEKMFIRGQGFLGLMSIRGKQAMQGWASEGVEDRHHALFGSISIILVGDPMQLPPVLV